MAETLQIPKWIRTAALSILTASAGVATGVYATGRTSGAAEERIAAHIASGAVVDADHETRLRAAELLLQQRGAILASHEERIKALQDVNARLEHAIDRLAEEIRKR